MNARQQTPPPGARKRFSQGGGVACSVRDKTHGAYSGDGVAFAVHERPVRGTRGTYRVRMRHGVSEVRTGRRHTLGIIFHDAK